MNIYELFDRRNLMTKWQSRWDRTDEETNRREKSRERENLCLFLGIFNQEVTEEIK